jgi:hypothetical protein
VAFDATVTKDGGDDEKGKYFVVLKAEGVTGICPVSLVTVTVKIECDSVQKFFPKGKMFTVELNASYQKELRSFAVDQAVLEKTVEVELAEDEVEEPAITEATATIPEFVDEEPQMEEA